METSDSDAEHEASETDLTVRIERSMPVVGLVSIDEQVERRIGEHHWMRDRIEAAVYEARAAQGRETGDADEVPAAMRRMQAGASGRVAE